MTFLRSPRNSITTKQHVNTVRDITIFESDFTHNVRSDLRRTSADKKAYSYNCIYRVRSIRDSGIAHGLEN